jgi:hypothetical protein
MYALSCNKLGDDLGPIFQKKRKRVREIRVSYFCKPDCVDIQFSMEEKKMGEEKTLKCNLQSKYLDSQDKINSSREFLRTILSPTFITWTSS